MQMGRPDKDRLFGSGQLNHAIAPSLSASANLVPSPSRVRLGRGRVKVLLLLI